MTNGDLTDITKWPLFGPEARKDGFQSVQAFPLRLRKTVIGTMNIFMAERVVYSDEDLQLCQALADVATIAILQNQAASAAQTVNSQLQRALDSRIAIEQAKGILAERSHIDMAEAFNLLRRFARDQNRQLSEVAVSVVTGELTLDASGRAPQVGDKREP